MAFLVKVREGDATTTKAIRVEHGPGIHLLMTDEEPFTITVKRGAEILEVFEDVTLDDLPMLDSTNLRFAPVHHPSLIHDA